VIVLLFFTLLSVRMVRNLFEVEFGFIDNNVFYKDMGEVISLSMYDADFL
jgi:hypothetical protein